MAYRARCAVLRYRMRARCAVVRARMVPDARASAYVRAYAVLRVRFSRTERAYGRGCAELRSRILRWRAYAEILRSRLQVAKPVVEDEDEDEDKKAEVLLPQSIAQNKTLSRYSLNCTKQNAFSVQFDAASSVLSFTRPAYRGSCSVDAEVWELKCGARGTS
eukprot:2792542-Rhodomonas_salina.5